MRPDDYRALIISGVALSQLFGHTVQNVFVEVKWCEFTRNFVDQIHTASMSTSALEAIPPTPNL